MKLANAANITKSKRGIADKKMAALKKRNAAIAARKGIPAEKEEEAAVAASSASKIEPSLDLNKPVVELDANDSAAVCLEHVDKIMLNPDVVLEGPSIFEAACLNLPGIEANAQPPPDNYKVNLKNLMTMTDNTMTNRIEPTEGECCAASIYFCVGCLLVTNQLVLLIFWCRHRGACTTTI